MPSQNLRIRVFVASSSDVQDERNQISGVIDELNKGIGQDKGFFLELLKWETDCYPAMGRPQGSINEQIGSYDIFIGIMWRRFGTPTGEAASGTEEEFMRAYESWEKNNIPPILFYFCKVPFYPDSPEELEQHKKVLEFRSKLSRNALVWEYGQHTEFANIVRPHLDKVLRTAFRELSVQSTEKTTLPETSHTSSSQALVLQRSKLRRPPSRLWAAIVGWFEYQRSDSLLRSIHKGYFERGLARPLIKNFDVPFRKWNESDYVNQIQKRITIVSGPAGVGKTIYLDHLFKELLKQGDVDLFVILNFRDIEEAIQTRNYLKIWESICTFFSRNAAVAMQNLPPAAIAYALNKKRVLLVIEDLHLAVSSMAALGFISEYFEQYHRWGNHISLIGTTREAPEKLPDALHTQARIDILSPIERMEDAQEFFFSLCTTNGLPYEQLTEHGDKLAKAFDTEPLRVPLFVVICASLVAHPVNPRIDVGRVLQMNTSEVFDAFIRQLYNRSALPSNKYGEFRATYERLALELWPISENFDEREINNHPNTINLPDSPFNLVFLESNGFIVRTGVLQGQLSFPHQAMADYLTAAAMLQEGDFRKLGENPQYLRIKGIAPFLAELIRQAEAHQVLEEIATAELSVFVEVVNFRSSRLSRPDNEYWTIPLDRIVQAAVEWATPNAKHRQSRETWEHLCHILESTKSTNWLKNLCQRIEQVKPVSREGIEALAAIQRKESENVLLQWLNTEECFEAFRIAAYAPHVRDLLMKFLEVEELKTKAGRAAFSVLQLCPEKDLQAKLQDWIQRHIAIFTKQDISHFVEICTIEMLRVIAYACRDQKLATKRRLSSVYAEKRNRALISPGTYSVPGKNGQTERVKINKPLLVPCISEKLPSRFSTVDKVQEDIDRKAGLQNIMTKHQALVALNHFEHDPLNVDQHGVLFRLSDEDVTEALRIGKKEIGLFVIPSVSKAIQTLSSQEQEGSTVSVAFRRVEEL